MKKFFKSLMLISVCLGLSATVNAKTFRYATTGDILGLDPHANNEGPTNTMKGNIYGRMLHRKADLSLEPDLATKWEKLDANTWRFSLRRGVKFHNGNDFNADDRSLFIQKTNSRSFGYELRFGNHQTNQQG